MRRLAFFALLPAALVWAAPSAFEMTLKEAEGNALTRSSQLKSLASGAEAAGEHADAQSAALYPRLSLGASFQYQTHVPTVNLPIPGAAGLSFGSHESYSVGPTLSYTIWDTGAARNAYRGFDLTAQSRGEDKKSAELQILLAVRVAYLRLQLALEELRLLNSSLSLSRAQNHDIEVNFRAGAATRLDRLDSQREVTGYELQFEQKQAEIASDLKDLLALTQTASPPTLSHPGPPDVPGVAIEVRLDPLDRSLLEASGWSLANPDENQPSLKSLALQTEASERAAESQKASLFPTLQLSASALVEYPDQINLKTVEQNLFLVSLSLPLFEGSRTRHLVEESHRQADVTRFAREQTRVNLERDFVKARELLESLRVQQKLSALDVQRSEEAARLYYKSYRGGKLNLIDVQGANNRALLAKVNAARINAQILNQIFVLKSLSGEAAHGQ